MKLTQKTIYALLLSFYIARNGRTRVIEVSEKLGLSIHFIEQVARKLRVAGVIVSIRGPGGGYELVETATIGQVMTAVGVTMEFVETNLRTPEYSILTGLGGIMSGNLQPIMDLTVRAVVADEDVQAVPVVATMEGSTGNEQGAV